MVRVSRYAIGGSDGVSLEDRIEQLWRRISRPYSSEFGHTLVRHNRASLEICA